MPVVSDTSPLLNLAIIGQLALLQQQCVEVCIPPAVLRELRLEEDLPGSQSLRESLGAEWLAVKEVQDLALVKVLRRDLDEGESEAIALALQIEAERVLLDEREGRRVAKAVGLNVTGVLGILLRARREGTLSSLQKAMDELQERAGFRIAAALYFELLREAGEAKST